MARVNLLVDLHAVEGKAAEAAALFAAEFVTRSQAEAGCIQYDLWIDRDDPHRMVVVETWASQADLDAHAAQGWFKVYGPQLDVLLRGKSVMRHLVDAG